MVAAKHLEFITKDDCPLCAETLANLVPLAAGRNVDLTIRNVEDDAALETFRERVPVIRNDSGDILAEGRITARQLRRVVRRARSHG